MSRSVLPRLIGHFFVVSTILFSASPSFAQCSAQGKQTFSIEITAFSNVTAPYGAMDGDILTADYTLNGVRASTTITWPQNSASFCIDPHSSVQARVTSGGNWPFFALEWGALNHDAQSAPTQTATITPYDYGYFSANYMQPNYSTNFIEGARFNTTNTNLAEPITPMEGYLGIYGGNYMAADMNGDGLTDIVHEWNDGGYMSVDVMMNNGDGTFKLQHWKTRAAGDGSTNQYVLGDFNGDGWTDMAVIWPNGNNVAVGVYLNVNGTGFDNGYNWYVPDTYKGWGQRFFAGDFDGDGASDLIRVGGHGGDNASGQTFIDAFTSMPASSRFSAFTRVADNLGNYSTTQPWIIGNFTGTPNRGAPLRTDLLRVTGDAGSTTIDVFPSNGTTMAQTRYETSAFPYGGYYVTGGVQSQASHSSILQIAPSGSLTNFVGHRNMGTYFNPTYWAQNNGNWKDGIYLIGTWWPARNGLIRIVPGT